MGDMGNVGDMIFVRDMGDGENGDDRGVMESFVSLCYLFHGVICVTVSFLSPSHLCH